MPKSDQEVFTTNGIPALNNISLYKYIQSPDHPNCTKEGYVAEHRLSSELEVGRLLTCDEIVHHIDENKINNDPKNLLVMSSSAHSKMHRIKTKRSADGKFTT